MNEPHSQPTFFAQNRRPSLALAGLMGAVLSLSLSVDSAEAQATEGSWTVLPYLMAVNPIHATVLHTGKVLIVSGSENDPDKHDNGDFENQLCAEIDAERSFDCCADPGA